jgi:hypothetical protein
MDEDKYLKQILQSQTLASDSKELTALQNHRADVEALLRKNFSDCSPTIRYGGSKAKSTMIKEAYDLDIISYFPRDDTAAGDTLEQIYNNVQQVLSSEYYVEQKPSALRIKDKSPENYAVDFHIDIVPGRYTDDSKTDVFLYRSSGEKKRLKTNLDVHIKHVKESGFTEAIRLLKLWRIRNGLRIKHFALELLTIELLKGKQSHSLSRQLEHVWQQLRENSDNISVQDPANASGNDLSELLNSAIRLELLTVAERSLEIINDSSWEDVFGPVEEKSKSAREEKIEILKKASTGVAVQSKPWSYHL